MAHLLHHHHHHHHYYLLPLILVQILFLILPSSSYEATQAIFSQPLQFLFGGQNLTDFDLTLSLSNDCGLILYKANIPVLDFNTRTTTSYCALFVNENGQLILVADNERIPTQTIGKNVECLIDKVKMEIKEDKHGVFNEDKVLPEQGSGGGG